MINILIGLVGLGIVVFVHELGHFLAARATGIRVTAFSIGWGKPILHKTIKGVDYRLGIFPVGGYCLMDGEAEFREALVSAKGDIRRTPGTFWGANPFKRIVVAVMGPLFNWIFAVAVIATISLIGYTTWTSPARIVLGSEVDQEEPGAADEAGLRTGDLILAIDGDKVTTSQDVSRIIAENPDKTLSITIEREKRQFELQVTPRLDRDSGAGKIGVYFWVDPVVSIVENDSSADIAGIQAGDRLLSIDGKPIAQQMDFFTALSRKPGSAKIVYERDNLIAETDLVMSWPDGVSAAAVAGISFKLDEIAVKETNPLAALRASVIEVQDTFWSSLKSLGVLFRGINLPKAVSGPLRITHMVGETAVASFQESALTGFIALFRFLAYISIVLSLMNLLPIPALDGGQILIFIVELIIRRPIKTRILYYYQLAGTVIIMLLLALTLISDAFFIFK